MGGEGSGRKPDLTKQFLSNKPDTQQFTPIASKGSEGIYLPNFWGVKNFQPLIDFLDDRYLTEDDADDLYVNVTGDTMSGELTVNANVEVDSLNAIDINTFAIEGSTIKQFDLDQADTLVVYEFKNTASGGTATIEVQTGFTVESFTTPGFVKNNSSGVFSGGNTIDISGDTNLAVTSPIVLTGDTISFSFSTNNTWTGTNTFDNNVTIDLASGSLVTSQSTGAIDLTLSNDTSAQGFVITKTETVRPSGTPEYFSVTASRNWSGAAVPANLLTYSFTDNATLSSGTDAVRLFNTTFARSGASNAVASIVDIYRISGGDTQTYTGSTGGTFNYLNCLGTVGPAYNSASAITQAATILDVDTTFGGSNAGAGTMTMNSQIIHNNASVTNVGTDQTYNHYCIRNSPTIVHALGTTVHYGLYHAPAVTGTITNYIIFAESGNIVLDSDSSNIQLGEDQDVTIVHNGTNFVITNSTGVMAVSSDVTVPDEAYGSGWNASLEVPTKNAVYDKIESILDGETFTGDIIVPDEAYGAGWNGNNEVPTKNAIYDKIETISGGHGTAHISVWTESAANATTTSHDIFDEDNYSSYSSTTNASDDFTYTATNGRFTYDGASTGRFLINFSASCDLTNMTGFILYVDLSGVQYALQEFHYIGSGAGDGRHSGTLHTIVEMDSTEYLNFRVGVGDTTGSPSNSCLTANVDIVQIA